MNSIEVPTIVQLENFRLYAIERLRQESSQLSLDELYDEWRIGNPCKEQLDRDAVAVAASLRDLDAGITGRPIEGFVAEFKKDNGLK